MELSKLISLLEAIAPPGLAEDFDNCKIGLIVKGSQDIKKVATALDPTPYAITRAAELGAQMLITHHTLIWDPVNKINDDLAEQLRLLLDHKLSLYSMHTNYDYADGGVNDTLACLLGLTGTEPFEGGRVGNVWETSLGAFAEMASRQLGCQVEYVGDDKKIIKRVALVAGSGFKIGLGPARDIGVDALFSSELKHDIIRGRGDVALLSAPHYYTEAPAMRVLADRLSPNVPAVFIDDPPEIKVVTQR